MNATLNISVDHSFEGTGNPMLNVELLRDGERIASTGVALDVDKAFIEDSTDPLTLALSLMALALSRLTVETVVR